MGLLWRVLGLFANLPRRGRRRYLSEPERPALLPPHRGHRLPSLADRVYAGHAAVLPKLAEQVVSGAAVRVALSDRRY